MPTSSNDPTQQKQIDLDELLPSDAPPSLPPSLPNVDEEAKMSAEQEPEDYIDFEEAGEFATKPGPVPKRFITGEAGTGKTFTIKQEVEDDPLYATLCASTGIAAVNLGAVTVNSLLKYFDTASLMENYERGRLQSSMAKIARSGVKNIAIDECSMIPAQQLDVFCDALSKVNGRTSSTHPLGLILIGDMCQLPPVKADWIFKASIWPEFHANTTRLTKVWRQSDPKFLSAINALRRGEGKKAAEILREIATFAPVTHKEWDGTTLVGKNDQVDNHNFIRLTQMKGDLYNIDSARWGKQAPEWTKHIPAKLQVKIGAYVMILTNDVSSGDFTYCNGDTGHIVAFEPGYVCVELKRTGQTVRISKIHRTQTTREEPDEVKGIPTEDLPEASGGRAPFGEISFDPDREVWHVGGVRFMPLRLAYASTIHKCVALGTRVLVEGKGAIPIEEVRVGDWVDTGVANELARVKALAQTEKPLHRIVTERGYSVVTSDDHRWLTERGMRNSRHFTPTTRLALCPPTQILGTNEIGQDVAWWLGLIVGDGNYTDRREGQIHFTNMCEALRKGFMKVAQKLGGKPNTRRDRRGCHLTNLPVRLRLEAWGLDYVTSTLKTVPEVVWRTGRSVWGAFLRGLFDADGSIKQSRFSFCSRSERLADEVQYLLLLLGIPTSRGEYTITSDGPYKGYRYWHIRVTACAIERFKALVGFSHPDKARGLAKWKPNRSISTFDGWDNVKKVESLGVIAPVMDIELETVHQLSFNGICGSNSQGLSLDAVQVDLRNNFMAQPSMTYVAVSRCRTAQGLRLVGTPELLEKRCTTDPQVLPFL
jgi:hypothetical protein